MKHTNKYINDNSEHDDNAGGSESNTFALFSVIDCAKDRPDSQPAMETMEYETARNLTLLFFLERLLERGEPRTLHDLSCQFGSKGFTKEMRQIAGGSQSGESANIFSF